MKSKNRIMTKYSFASIETIQHVIIYIRLEFTYFSIKKRTQICKKGVPKEYIRYQAAKVLADMLAGQHRKN